MPRKGKAVAPRATSAQVAAALDKSRGLVSVAARALGISRTTLYAYVEKDPALQAALSDARELTTDVAEAKLFQAVEKGEAWAICFYLKTQGKGRGYVERQEHTGEGGGAVQHQLTHVVVTRRVVDGDA